MADVDDFPGFAPADAEAAGEAVRASVPRGHDFNDMTGPALRSALASAQSPAPTWTLPLIDTTQWIGKEPPPRRWIVDDWLVRGTGALLIGQDGVGKSLLAQQLATCVAAGKPFLGLNVTQAPALYITCEDGVPEVWRRQRAVNAAVGVPIDAAPAMVSSLVGWTDVGLGRYDEMGGFEVSPAFHGIEAMAKDRGAGLIVLDNIAHLYPGNENVRREVALFCSALDRMAANCDATVLVIGHPAKVEGSEYSGSTGWSAHVRQRWFMDRIPMKDGGTRDSRVLRKSKANYSEAGTEVQFLWNQWAFRTEHDLPDDDRAAYAAIGLANEDNAAFLACLGEMTRQRRNVSEKSGRNLAPAVFARMPESKGIGKERLEAAMDRLFRIDAIERAELWMGADRKPVFGLRETGVLAAGNTAGNAA